MTRINVCGNFRIKVDVGMPVGSAMALMLIHGDRSYIDAAARAARQLVKRRA